MVTSAAVLNLLHDIALFQDFIVERLLLKRGD